MLPEDELRQALTRLPLVDVAGPFHRVIRLRYSYASLSRTRTLGVLTAIGSRLVGGRFNRKETLPTVHVGVEGTIHGVLDLTDATIINALGTSQTELDAPWRMIQAQGAEVPTQRLGRLARESRRIQALRYWSRPSTQKGRCVAIFLDRLVAPSAVTVMDDSGQLAPERLPKLRGTKRHQRPPRG